MRQLKTFILRLLIDQDISCATTEFHGSLQAIEEAQTHPFKSGQALLFLLQELTQEKRKDEIANLNEEFES
ncbi:MAG: hypothetical protein JW862_09505 [Anaerolineales bacterium]|nr:hypothetical protein [Anaerolineales bacterium]